MAEFITIVDIKTYTSISSQIDEKFISPYIPVASDIHLEPVLGTALSNELKELIEDAGSVTGVTGAAGTLLVTYIRPAMLWFTISEALPFLDKKIKAGGIIRSAAVDSTNLDQEQYNEFEQVIKDKAFFYRDRLVSYLNDNASSYPSYGSCVNPKNNSIGIYLGAE